MKIAYFLFLLVIGITFSACDNQREDIDDGVVLDEDSDERFQSCYHTDDLALKTCNAVVRDFFGDAIFKKHIQFDSSESFINCQQSDGIEMKDFGDSTCCLPNTYDMVYTLRENGETIFEFRMVSGSDMEFEHISTQSEAQLLGYKKLLAGNFPITYAKARAIAKKNGCTDDMILELVYDEKGKADNLKSYYWEIENSFPQDRTVLVQIDPFSGKISRNELMVRAGD